MAIYSHSSARLAGKTGVWIPGLGMRRMFPCVSVQWCGLVKTAWIFLLWDQKQVLLVHKAFSPDGNNFFLA